MLASHLRQQTRPPLTNDFQRFGVPRAPAGQALPAQVQTARLPHSGRVAESAVCRAGNGGPVPLHVSEPYRGPNSPVSGFRLWLPGGGLVHVQAAVDPTAVVEATSVVHEGASVGRECVIGSGSVVGSGVTVGERTRLHHQVSLQHCSIGAQCVLHSGARVGGRGFVFRLGSDGALQQAQEHQTFRVELRDNVEVGANTVIDRGSWRDTVIDKNAKLDSLVHVGHDSTIGRSCIICSNASVGASTVLGDDVIIGHKAAVKDHVVIASQTRIAAKAGVVRDIKKAGDYAGHPAVLAKDYRSQAQVSKARRVHQLPESEISVDASVESAEEHLSL